MRVPGMVTGPLLAVLVALAGVSLAAEPQVRVDGLLLSASFDETPVPAALQALRRVTGIQIVLPASVSEKTLTLTSGPVPMEVLVRRMVEALKLGGFALVYATDGEVERLIVVERQERNAPSSAADDRARPAPAVSVPDRATVPFLMPSAEARSMRLGAPGQLLVVESSPTIKTRTRECDGTPGDYPVQSVLVVDATATYVTSIIVCSGQGLTPGRTMTLSPSSAATPAADSTYARFGASD